MKRGFQGMAVSIGLFVVVAVAAGTGVCLILRPSGGERPIDPRFTGVLPRGEASSLVRSGQRWTFRVASMHAGTQGVETWDVMAVGSQGVTTIVTGSKSSSTATPGLWKFDLPERDTTVPVHLIGSETVAIDSSTTILCDVIQYDCPDGMDWIRSWVPVSRAGGSPEFPGVVRQTRFEGRGRIMVERELIGITAK